ncbi:MAG TPA: sigma-70 family RNA polymerase sigma factor [Oscillospiraceae bacterium]|nr:sigma-70 family RNA polymerase sigma factor [Oscillospiraceae bacterium]
MWNICESEHNYTDTRRSVVLSFYLSLLDTEEEKSKMEILYHTYNGLMLKIAFDILNDYDLSNDALHNAFLKIVRHLDKLDENPCHKTKAYMVLVIESVSKNMYNKRKRQDSTSYDELEYDIPDNKDFEDEISSKSTVEYVYKKIELLPKIYKDVLTLKFVNDLSDKEIAEILEISNSAARKRLERAKIKLTELLNKE